MTADQRQLKFLPGYLARTHNVIFGECDASFGILFQSMLKIDKDP